MYSDIPAAKRRLLEKKGIMGDVDLCYTTPYKFYDFTRVVKEPTLAEDGRHICLKGVLDRVEKRQGNGRTTIACRLACKGCTVYVNWIGQAQMESFLKKMEGLDIYVCGKLEYNPAFHSFSMLNPMRASGEMGKAARWAAVYPKYKGVGDEWLRKAVRSSLDSARGFLPETIPQRVLKEAGMPGRRQALSFLHYPKSAAEIAAAARRNVFEDLLYLSCRLERGSRDVSKGTMYNLKDMRAVNAARESLPYELTEGQASCLSSILGKMKDGRRVDALVQGDVGCGKSVVAFLLMLAMAGSGWQAVVMAPTVVLAGQHYEQLSRMAEPLGIKAAFLGGKVRAAEKRRILAGLADGSISLAVGTHSLISEAVAFKDLALAVVDEEHRFGVKQREALAEKARAGTHTVSFSATPIPRSMAAALYKGTDVYEIKELPPGRSPVRTDVTASSSRAAAFVKSEVEKGRQAYVVCPLIDADDPEDKPMTVKEAAALYKEVIGVEPAVVTGRQSKEEAAGELARFKRGECPILVATTVVEVGVDVPNATVMVVEDAWMFGLSQLHQLRGRVGRGRFQGYCVLVSDRDSERLSAMKKTSDGFAIAEMDLGLRGAGNVLGEEQSGRNRLMAEAMAYPRLFAAARMHAERMVDDGEDVALVEEMEKRSDKAYVKALKMKIYAARAGSPP